jgi:hypothetical protein
MADLGREKVIKGLEEAYKVIEDYVPSRYMGYSRLACCDAIALLREHDDCENCAIAIEDRQPVVRCKDCKHYDPDTQSCNDGLDGIFFPDWFCVDGERR